MYTIEYTINMRSSKPQTQQTSKNNHEERIKPSSAAFKKFEHDIWNYYKKNKRDLPWRHTTDPYHILVSEVMLQQTQVSRVIPKYQEFLKKFPNIKALAKATKPEVLTVWQGLGYNRRALFLKKTCETLLEQNPKHPQFPTYHEELLKLPGIGQSTAGAILNFSFNIPAPFIETNIRAVFLYYFFKGTSSVSDIHIYELIQETLKHKKQKDSPREWFYALYDYGSMLKATLGKNKTELHKQSKHYNKQTSFKGSNREIRSSILKLILETNDTITETLIIDTITQKLLQATVENIKKNIEALEREGFIHIIDKSTPQSRGTIRGSGDSERIIRLVQ